MAFLLASSSLVWSYMMQQQQLTGEGEEPGAVLCECLRSVRTCLLRPEWCRECLLAADESEDAGALPLPSQRARALAEQIIHSHEPLFKECVDVLREAMATSMSQPELEECADAMALRVLAGRADLEASCPPSLFGPSCSRHEAAERLYALVERHLDMLLLELGYYLVTCLLEDEATAAAAPDEEAAVASAAASAAAAAAAD